MRKLRASLPALRPSERRVGEFVQTDPTLAVNLSITEVAEASNTSVASVVRFSRSLGYSGYAEFRRELASAVGREQVSRSRFGVSDSDISADDDAQSVVAKVAFHEGKAIEDTAAAINLETLDAVAGAIVAAPRVDIYGVASSGVAATDLQQKLHRVGMVSFAWSDVHLALTSAAVLTPGCVAIGFSHSGLTVEIGESLAAARARGATTVLVTNFPASPISRDVDHLLTTSASETRYRPGAMSGRIAQLAVIDFLFVRVAQQLTDQFAEPLEQTYNAVQPHRLSYDRPRTGH
ncbi:MAG: MurR/RpiR family transcriptional regulator [Microcella sp.]|nr:MAG: MurR/RpiR family transcriptional regulator [Microcella sp.]